MRLVTCAGYCDEVGESEYAANEVTYLSNTSGARYTSYLPPRVLGSDIYEVSLLLHLVGETTFPADFFPSGLPQHRTATPLRLIRISMRSHGAYRQGPFLRPKGLEELSATPRKCQTSKNEIAPPGQNPHPTATCMCQAYILTLLQHSAPPRRASTPLHHAEPARRASTPNQ